MCKKTNLEHFKALQIEGLEHFKGGKIPLSTECICPGEGESGHYHFCPEING